MTKKVFIGIYLAGLFLFFIVGPGCKKKSMDSQKPLRIGYMICNSLPESRARFEPISAYLQEKLNNPYKLN